MSKRVIRGKYTDEVVENSNKKAKYRDRQCTVLREDIKGKQWVVVWDGTETPQYVNKRFLKIMSNRPLERPYTKGKWYLQEYTDAYTNIVRCDNGKHSTLFIASTPQGTQPEVRANARLMAAAPDLLEALEEIVSITDRDHAVWIKAKDAIEKAISNQNEKEVGDDKISPSQPVPDLGMCKRCKNSPATTDYNGHGHYVCKHCDKMLNDEFEREYQ